MKKIDLHIHTKASISDSAFEFDIEKLKEYVQCCELDCIAITNHNLFDIEQFKLIKKELDIEVFPGIEINIENGHLLLISQYSDIENFAAKCSYIESSIRTKDDSITVENLKSIFDDLNRYLLIPHYEKKPSCSEKVLEQLKPYISAGEVNSIKKFLYCQSSLNALTHVYFSDLRIKHSLSSFSTRQTYFDIDEITLQSLKLSLQDKNKIQLSSDEGHKVFQVLENGLKISTGLTVILGERSSGKSYTLNEISKNYDNIKYIKQFSLLEKDEAKDRERFNTMLATKQSSVSEEFLKEFKDVVNDVIDIDLELDQRNISSYLETLKKHATETQREDSFSKSNLFNEDYFTLVDLTNLKKLISASIYIAENKEYKYIINKYVSDNNLDHLIVDLIREYYKKIAINNKYSFANTIISDIKNKLRLRTAATVVDDINLNNIILHKARITKFNKLVNLLKKDHYIEKKEINDFKVEATSTTFKHSQELKNLSKSRQGFSDAFNAYDNAYQFLQELKKKDMISPTDYYKYFVNIQFKVLNKYNFEVSGGEMSEFNLLNEINNALQYDMLLLDEPESSFDNMFLKNSVNHTIKYLSKFIPVIVVTHNNTVGASIKPDYLVYTKKIVSNSNVEYELYTGYPSNKLLTNLSGKSISNHNMLLNCLEAGEDAYEERGKNYEMLEN